MKEFINSLTGTRMTVADDRQAEYLAAGHKLISPKEQQPINPADEAAAQTADENEGKTAAAPTAAAVNSSKRLETNKKAPASKPKTAARK